MTERTQADYDRERETQIVAAAPAEPLTDLPASIESILDGAANLLEEWRGQILGHEDARCTCDPGIAADAVRQVRAQLATQQAAWTKIAELFKTGGMDDPAFLVGMIEAEHEAWTAQRAAIRELWRIWETRRDDFSKEACDQCEGSEGCGELVMCPYHSVLSQLADVARLLGVEPGNGKC